MTDIALPSTRRRRRFLLWHQIMRELLLVKYPGRRQLVGMLVRLSVFLVVAMLAMSGMDLAFTELCVRIFG